MATYKVIGINDDTDICQHCGKKGLKRVVWISEILEDGTSSEPVAYGTTCAANLLGYKKDTKAGYEGKLEAEFVHNFNVWYNAECKKIKANWAYQDVMYGPVCKHVFIPTDMYIEVITGKLVWHNIGYQLKERYPFLYESVDTVKRMMRVKEKYNGNF